MTKNNGKGAEESELDGGQVLADLVGSRSSELTVQNEFRKKLATAMVSDDKAVIVTFIDTRGGVESIPVPTKQNVNKLCLVFETVPAAKESIEPTIEPIFYVRFKRLVTHANFQDKNRLDKGVEDQKVTRN